MDLNTHDEQLLKKLASAIIENPRATTKELAEMVGISKATLHRFCGTRENLVQMITTESEKALHKIIAVANAKVDDYETALNELIKVHFDNEEYLVFTCGVQSSLENKFWGDYSKSLDHFFLNGQKHGAFRIELSVPLLSELFIASICGAIDAQQRGRIASFGMQEGILNFYLNGARKQ